MKFDRRTLLVGSGAVAVAAALPIPALALRDPSYEEKLGEDEIFGKWLMLFVNSPKSPGWWVQVGPRFHDDGTATLSHYMISPSFPWPPGRVEETRDQPLKNQNPLHTINAAYKRLAYGLSELYNCGDCEMWVRVKLNPLLLGWYVPKDFPTETSIPSTKRLADHYGVV